MPHRRFDAPSAAGTSSATAEAANGGGGKRGVAEARLHLVHLLVELEVELGRFESAAGRVAALRERTLASTAASLRVAEQTERVAGATLRELDAQSESLERTRKNLDDAEKSAAATAATHASCAFRSGALRAADSSTSHAAVIGALRSSAQ